MTIVPINVATVARTLQDILSHSVEPKLEYVPVTRGSPPDDSAIMSGGWIGIYPESINYQPRTVGVGGGFMQYELRINVVLRFMHTHDPEVLEDSLEDLVQAVVSVVLTNFTLSGTVEATSLGQVRYADYNKGDSGGFTQTAIATFTFTGSTDLID